ncbi:hypothetical protein XU18_1050 [Perkinsela sp. CCAP 1560/4]|nr:hypothetical protein XU18_1050 [Perkinsela sp. CCAP 1560/4]|eukprot:KNH08481.1 hypothetical protein XU18_1050 [Perkinsela sp. CCAP 1560/4]
MHRQNPSIWRRLYSRLTPIVESFPNTHKFPNEHRYVVCGIVFEKTPHSIKSRSRVHDMSIGVNYAVHRSINEHIHCFPGYTTGRRSADHTDDKRHCSAPKPVCHSPTLLKGILKGCAEQNALGSLAASGVPYAAIRKVYILSLEQAFLRRSQLETPWSATDQWRKSLQQRLDVDKQLPVHRSFLPCRACVHHLRVIGGCVHRATSTGRKKHHVKRMIDVFTMQNMDPSSVHHMRFPDTHTDLG